MRKKLLISLFIRSLVSWTHVGELLHLLPNYAIELGANPEIAGYQIEFDANFL